MSYRWLDMAATKKIEAQKTIVITGISRGLGKAMAEGFIQRGHVVLGCGRSGEARESMARRYRAPHDFSQVDVTSDADVQNWAARLLDRYGPPDLLINNAAIITPNARLWEVPPEDFSRIIDINLKGVFNVLRHFLGPMLHRNTGVIVNFSSGWGRSVEAEVAPYCATKWGVEGLTKALALELPDGMAAIPLNPGIIHTEMLESCFGASASTFPNPAKWAEHAVPFLLTLGPAQNGRSVTVGP